MKKIGIITIHRIYNYGSVLQAYALQCVCMKLGYKVEVIDYVYPNAFHQNNEFRKGMNTCFMSGTDKLLAFFFKCLYAVALYKQHVRIRKFLETYINISSRKYTSPRELSERMDSYDIYMTGSDQIWNPRYTGGDSSFFLDFLDEKNKKISYSSSFGVAEIPSKLYGKYADMLDKFQYISVRENSGVELVRKITGRSAKLVLDPTLLLTSKDWIKLSSPKKIRGKYILCYFLNYTFNGYPYIDELAEHFAKITGYRLVKIARPPHKLFNPNTTFCVSASPEDFINLVANSELVLTTSFHGTAFALNFMKPIFSIIKSAIDSDSRQKNLLDTIGLSDRIIALGDPFPAKERIPCDYTVAAAKLEALRTESFSFLNVALNN